MTRPRSLLVATDFSETAGAALAYARELAAALGATLHVLHVTDDVMRRYMRGGRVDLPPDLQADIENASRSELDRLVTAEDRRERRAIAEVRMSNDAAGSIVDYANTAGIDLIVIGSHGRHGLSRALLGSVAERVARTAPCPVLIVRVTAPTAAASPSAA